MLLASLAIREEDGDWREADAIARRRICDPACGTGTLLMAAAERIRDLRNHRHRRRSANPANTPEGDSSGSPANSGAGDVALGRALVEDVLWGYDSNLTATHMAASTLGMLSPATQFSRINVHRTSLGVFDGVPYVGSLEFLTGQARLAGWPEVARQVDDAQTAPLPPPMDLVIMNLPFTRDSLRYDQFSVAEELAIKGRETELIRDHPHRAAARLHSSGGAFVLLAEKILKEDESALALVLPSVVPTAPGNLALRQFLAQQFWVEAIVTSHDPERIFFSENTSIGEVLIVCRRWSEDAPKPPTLVVNLARNPATPLEALDTAARIRRAGAGEIDSARDFTAQRVDPERIAAGDWAAVNFLRPLVPVGPTG